jgi:hypothetical protein
MTPVVNVIDDVSKYGCHSILGLRPETTPRALTVSCSHMLLVYRYRYQIHYVSLI